MTKVIFREAGLSRRQRRGNGADQHGAVDQHPHCPTGISRSSGTVSEDYTLFAGVTANNDYSLLENLDAVDAGVDAGITVDKANSARPRGGGYDIGAFEFGSVTLIMCRSSSKITEHPAGCVCTLDLQQYRPFWKRTIPSCAGGG
jgi:hypothetical protein